VTILLFKREQSIPLFTHAMGVMIGREDFNLKGWVGIQ